jgi:ABC-type uncharacterized transport system substrate-binding protein
MKQALFKVISIITQMAKIVRIIRVGGGVKKALKWLLLIAPHTKRVFVPVKFDTSAAESSLADLKDVATILNVDLLISNIEGRDDLRTALSSIPKDIDAVFIPHSLLIVSNLDTIVEAAVKRRLPTASGPAFINMV